MKVNINSLIVKSHESEVAHCKDRVVNKTEVDFKVISFIWNDAEDGTKLAGFSTEIFDDFFSGSIVDIGSACTWKDEQLAHFSSVSFAPERGDM